MDAVDARQLLLSVFPNAPATWFGGQARNDRRVDAFLVSAGSPSEARPFYVTSLKIDGRCVGDVVSEYPHIPYDAALVNAKPPRSAAEGVFVSAWPVHPPEAAAARFHHHGAVRAAPVVSGHCALIDWDTAWLSPATRPLPASLLVDGVWHPTVSGVVAAPPGEFSRAYIAHAGDRSRDHAWAPNAFYDATAFEEKRAMVECVLEAEALTDDASGRLAAGPIGDLIGAELLDYLESNALARGRWVPLLHDAYWPSAPALLKHRLQKLLGLRDS